MPTTFFMPSSGHRKSNAKLKLGVSPSKGVTANAAPVPVRAAYASVSFAAPAASLLLGWLQAALLKVWKAAIRSVWKREFSKWIFSGAL